MYHLYNQKSERSTLDVVVAQYSRLVPTAVLRYIIREWNTEGGYQKNPYGGVPGALSHTENLF